MKKNIIIVSIVLVSFGCGQGYKLTSNNYRVTDKGKFRLKNKFHLADTTVISTTNLYQYTCFKDTWFKFYNDGRVLLGYFSTIPKAASDSIYGFAGFYKINNKEIKIEMSYAQKRNDWYILEIEGKIVGDTLMFYKDNVQGTKRNIRHFTSQPQGCYYIKTNEQYFLRQPDW